MQKLLLFLLVCVASVAANAAAPTDESLHRFFEVTQTPKLLDGTRKQLKTLAQQTLLRAFNFPQMSTDEKLKAKPFFDMYMARMDQVVRDQLDWDRLKSKYAAIYRDLFTQEEIDALIAFYSSPVGQAYVTKTPMANQKISAAINQEIAPIRQQAEKMAAESVANFKAPSGSK